MYFGLYDTFREKNPFKDDKGAKGLLSKFCIAQTVAIASGYASYPFDTIRRRLQMQSEKVCVRRVGSPSSTAPAT